MFERRALPSDVERVREAYAPDALVLDVGRDFETLPPAVAEDLGLLVDSLQPAVYDPEWLPPDAPEALVRYAGSDFTIGMPDDGTVAWTRQTTPPTVLVKYRARGTPDDFLDFLLSEALVQIGLDLPEQFLPFFGERYRALDAAVDLGPSDVYQLAAALFDAWVGLHTRPVFESWGADDEAASDSAVGGDADATDPLDVPRLSDAWVDAGSRLDGRLDGLPAEVARGKTSFAEAAEFACAAVKHGRSLPAPFAALDTAAYREYGADYAVKWAETTFEKLRGDDAD